MVESEHTKKCSSNESNDTDPRFSQILKVEVQSTVSPPALILLCEGNEIKSNLSHPAVFFFPNVCVQHATFQHELGAQFLQTCL